MEKSLILDVESEQNLISNGKFRPCRKDRHYCWAVTLTCVALAVCAVAAARLYIEHNYVHHEKLFQDKSEKSLIDVEIMFVVEEHISLNRDWRGDVSVAPAVNDKTCVFPKSERVECNAGKSEISKDTCESRGCCWTSATSDDSPSCFYPVSEDNSTYTMHNLTSTNFGYSAFLTRDKKSQWPEDVMILQWDVMYETNERLHFKIYDPNSKRYEVPIETPPITGRKPSAPMYKTTFSNSSFGFNVTRVSNSSSVLFGIGDTKLVFADQYIEISTTLPTKYVYGFGEHRGRLLHDVTNGFSLSTWARDQGPRVGANLYGVHPLFIGLEESGEAYGVFLLNSNAMQVTVVHGNPPVLTYQTIGGILDFYIFTGPSPENVVTQYLQVIGKPYMPPYWGLGYHLCRYGYKNSTKLKEVIKRVRDDGFPYDTQWVDIDYMNKYFDWTYDKSNFLDLPAIVKDLHDKGQHYINIVDPGIRNQTGYPTFDEGLKNGVFITKSNTTDPIIGVVWPGKTAFPDFFNPATQKWWLEQARPFHNLIEFDGLWTDMNEPSNFVQGSVDGCTKNKYDNPPFTPKIVYENLANSTICPSAEHKIGLHYNLHSLYGHSEIIASVMALHELRPNKRTIVISRSTFPSSGRYAGHWTGDTVSTWADIRYSIAGILNFQFFGIPFTGADVCGFMGTTNGELCVRWTQLGAFYPFMRNHNNLGSPDQDPGADMFNIDQKAAMLTALRLRYTLLPYLYTLLYRAHVEGATVARPLWFEFSQDVNTYSIDDQLMWGESLLISPVVEEGKTSVNAYFPADTWVDILSGEVIKSKGSRVMVDAPLDKIPVYQRAGSIIPVNTNRVVTTTEQRKTAFSLWVALDDSSLACGSLYWDDGETLGATEYEKFNFIYFQIVNSGKLTTNITHNGYKAENMTLEGIVISNVGKDITSAMVNGKQTTISKEGLNQRYFINGFKADLLNDLTIQWS